MTVTRLTDSIIPAVFVPYMLKETMTKTAIFQSGILRQDAQLSSVPHRRRSDRQRAVLE